MGGPVAVDKMEEVQLRNKAGRIRKTRPRKYRNEDGPGGATGTNKEGLDIGTLTYTAMYRRC